MENSNSKPSNSYAKIALFIVLIISGIIAASGAVIMTDLGQVFGVQKPTVVSYFLHNSTLILISFLLLIGGMIINYKIKFFKKWLMGGFCLLWLVAVFSTKYLVPYFMFRTHQHDAVFIDISESGEYLADDAIVYAIDLNGEQKAYPQEFIWQGHIVGGDFGDDNVLFTYCVMTNLASPYLGEIDNKPVEFKVLAQTNSNLLIWETNSGEIIQQITQTCEFSGNKLTPIPILEMTWGGYKKLYPNGKVFFNDWNTPMEKMMNVVFDSQENIYGEEWMFETVKLDDERLPTKEHIIGYRDVDNGKELAFSKSFIKNKGIYNAIVGNKKIVFAHFPEYETIVAFNREKDGEELIINEIDVHGNTAEYGKLEKEFIYNGVFWAVWLHYYPETELLK